MTVKKALVFSFVEKYFGLVAQLATTMVIARLLTPAEFGVFALAMSVTMLVTVFRDLGIGQYLVQERDLTHERMRAALGILVVSSGLLAAGVFLGSGQVARFYGNDDLKGLLQILAVNFIGMPLGALATASFRREMQFSKLALIGILSVSMSSLVSVVLAFQGFSYYSLAWGSLAGTAVTALSCHILGPHGLPRMPGFAEARHVLRYSSYATLNGFLETLEDRLGATLLGKYSDFVNVGLFERSSSLAQMFQRVIMQSVWSVAMPAFAKLSRDDAGLAEPYGRAVGMVCALGAIFFTWMLIYADTIVHVMLGDTWAVAVPVVRLIVAGSFFGLPNALSGSLLVATGQIKTQTVVTMVLRGASIAAVAIGVSGGALGVASCLIVSSCLANAWLLYFLRSRCDVKLVMREAAKAYVLCVAPALVALGFRALLGAGIVPDAVGFALSLAVWVGLLVLTRHSLWREIMQRRAAVPA